MGKIQTRLSTVSTGVWVVWWFFERLETLCRYLDCFFLQESFLRQFIQSRQRYRTTPSPLAGSNHGPVRKTVRVRRRTVCPVSCLRLLPFFTGSYCFLPCLEQNSIDTFAIFEIRARNSNHRRNLLSALGSPGSKATEG